jgi:hypothetical protein
MFCQFVVSGLCHDAWLLLTRDGEWDMDKTDRKKNNREKDREKDWRRVRDRKRH